MDPASYHEYVERFRAHERIFGRGFGTSIALPCPFCAAPDFLVYRILDSQAALAAGATCRACGRSARVEFHHLANGTALEALEVVQTGGPDPPAWCAPIRRG